MSDSQPFVAFAGQKYLSLETVRKNGTAVRTPVWFAGEPPAGTPATLYFYTIADTGKMKRIRNNPRRPHRAMRYARECKGVLGGLSCGNSVRRRSRAGHETD